MKTIIAIDPGVSGGLAIGRPDKETLLYSMPETEGDILTLLQSWTYQGGARIYLEEVGGYIKGNPAPGSAMFNFGRQFGFILGCCAALELPLQLVKPQQWQRGLELPAGGTNAQERKRKLKAEAQRRHPGLKITLKTCDALLLLDYAQQKEKLNATT